ncbi:hypothetical protein [Candidatus Vidania fulgoroideorum]
MIRAFLRKNNQKKNLNLINCNLKKIKIFLEKKELNNYIKSKNTRNLEILLKKKFFFILYKIKNFLHKNITMVVLKKKSVNNSSLVKINPIIFDKKTIIKYIVNEVEVYGDIIPNEISILLNKNKKIYTSNDIENKNVYFKSKINLIFLL